MEIMKDDVKKALRVANYIKDQAKKLKGKVRNYSGLKAAFASGIRHLNLGSLVLNCSVIQLPK